MLKALLTTTCALSLVACVKQDGPPDEIARAIPTAEQVSIKLPGSQAKMLGDIAPYYVVTRDVTRTFNGGSAWVLILIHTIVQFPVTTVNANTYTWGPWSDALDPAEYKLDVTAVGDGTYDYQLSGRSKTEAGAQFEVVIAGHADPRPGDLQGNGDFMIDFDAGKRVNPVDSGDGKGQVAVQYDLAARHLDLGYLSTDDHGEPVELQYAYNETSDGGGNMVFEIEADMGGTALKEWASIRSRWQATGAGRSDAELSGGDLTTGAMASECWNTMFRTVFYTDSVSFAPTEGAASDCVFSSVDLP